MDEGPGKGGRGYTKEGKRGLRGGMYGGGWMGSRGMIGFWGGEGVEGYRGVKGEARMGDWIGSRPVELGVGVAMGLRPERCEGNWVVSLE